MKKLSLIFVLLCSCQCGSITPLPTPIFDAGPPPVVVVEAGPEAAVPILVATCADACKVDPLYCEEWCENAREIPAMQDRITCVANAPSYDEAQLCQ
jgi:hypothetical protein